MMMLRAIAFCPRRGDTGAGAPEEDTEGGVRHGGRALPYFDDAGGALEWGNPTLIDGRSDERAGTQDRETKRQGWTQ
jgi:hypothetical protein